MILQVRSYYAPHANGKAINLIKKKRPFCRYQQKGREPAIRSGKILLVPTEDLKRKRGDVYGRLPIKNQLNRIIHTKPQIQIYPY
jgi:hypothetical protein